MANGLINQQTDLKSLKYSSMPLGSQSPYVTKDIGQAPETQAGLELRRRIDDTSRIAQMLVNKPGLNYLLSEAALQQINAQDKLQKARDKGKTLGGAILQQLGNTVVNTVKIAASTLAQVPVNGTGTHFVKGFRTDTYLQPTNGNTRSGFAQFFGAGGIEGAQYALRGETVPGTINKENQNFGETSGITGKFNPIPSKFDYNGEVFPEANETKNTPKEDWASKEFYNSTLASRGQVIPVSKTEIRPVEARNADTGELTTLPGFNTPFQQAPKAETTLTPGAIGISNQTTGSITSGEVKITPFKESEEIRRSKADTEQNIINALTGSAITLKRENPQDRETTASPGTIGTTNQNITADLPDNGDLPGKTANTYSGEVKYYDSQSAHIQDTFNLPLRDTTTTPAPSFAKPQTVTPDTPKYFHPSITTNKYLGNSDAGPVPDPADFAEGRESTYTDSIKRRTQEDFGQPLKNTTEIPNTIGRPKGRTVEEGPVAKFIPPHVVREDLDTIGPPPEYSPEKTYIAYKRNVTTLNQNVTKEARVNLGDQGGRSDYENKLLNAFWTTSPDRSEIDKVNNSDVSSTRLDGTVEGRDLAKLYFEIITPEGSKFLHFRAFIDSIDDNYNADWQGYKYVGRGEDFYTYGGFSREISLSFKIAAATRSELRPLYRKMVYLASSTAPTYGSVGGFMRGTLARLTVGSYFDQIPGVITSVKYSLIDDIPWEIAMSQPEGGEKGVQELPTGLQCSIAFKPIHDFAPRTGFQYYFTSKEPEKAFFDADVYTAVNPPESKLPVVTSSQPAPVGVTGTKAKDKKQEGKGFIEKTADTVVNVAAGAATAAGNVVENATGSETAGKVVRTTGTVLRVGYEVAKEFLRKLF